MIRFAVTIFISAFLLFQVQPLIARYILPWFGGTPAVWTTCMLFFQVLLLAGYSYSHFVTSVLKPRVQSILHISVLLVSLVFLPIIPRSSLKPIGDESPTMQILILLGITIGLPYILLSTTGPLIQAWFSRQFPGRSPYRLFALSNFGSLIALISYPFAFEPFLRLSNQAWLWSGAYLVFVGSCCWCAFSSAFLQKNPAEDQALTTPQLAELKQAPARTARKPNVLDMLLWLGLSAVPSILLLASTSQICQEVAVVPFLWILPLSLYLVSFIICFDNPFWYSRSFFGLLTIGSIIAATYCLFSGISVPLNYQLLAFAVALFSCCMSCHGELAASKPDSQYLTLFYLMISLGGALGGIFVVVVAPRIFLNYWELHVGYIAALVFIVLAFARNGCWSAFRTILTLFAAGMVMAGAYFLYEQPKVLDDYWFLKLAFLVSVVFSLAFAVFGLPAATGNSQPLQKGAIGKSPSKANWMKRILYGVYIVAGLAIASWIGLTFFHKTEKLAGDQQLTTRVGLLAATGILFLMMAAAIAFSDMGASKGNRTKLDTILFRIRAGCGLLLIGVFVMALFMHFFSAAPNVKTLSLFVAIGVVFLMMASMIEYAEPLSTSSGNMKRHVLPSAIQLGLGVLLIATMAYAFIPNYLAGDVQMARICLFVSAGILFLMMAITIAQIDTRATAGQPLQVNFAAIGLGTVYGVVLIGGITTALMYHVLSDKDTDDYKTVDQRRDFYGVTKVREFVDRTKEGKFWKLEDDWSKLILINGRINHGEEFTRVEKRMRPTTYYAPGSGIGLAVANHPARKQDDQKIKIGVIGLGTGTMAAWAGERGGEKDEVRFYEINPEVKDIASNTFFFLKGSKGDVTVVLGDARIQLERELELEDIQNFDVLAVDAFSSDAIPRHLITKECFDLYWKHLKADGILAFHISNRYLDLDPVVYQLARRADYPAILINYYPSEKQESSHLADTSSWVLITKNERFLKDPVVVEAMSSWDKDMKDIYWTDDFGSLWQIVNRPKED